MDYDNIGHLMQSARESRGITQAEMAKYCGLTKNHVSAIERGVNKPSAKMLLEYAEKCGMSVDELLGRTEDNRILPELKYMLESMDEKQQEKLVRLIRLMAE